MGLENGEIGTDNDYEIFFRFGWIAFEKRFIVMISSDRGFFLFVWNWKRMVVFRESEFLINLMEFSRLFRKCCLDDEHNLIFNRSYIFF